jgi:hypothetical protein
MLARQKREQQHAGMIVALEERPCQPIDDLAKRLYVGQTFGR